MCVCMCVCACVVCQIQRKQYKVDYNNASPIRKGPHNRFFLFFFSVFFFSGVFSRFTTIFSSLPNLSSFANSGVLNMSNRVCSLASGVILKNSSSEGITVREGTAFFAFVVVEAEVAESIPLVEGEALA